jgi:DNA-binding IclR family transcriptional regulator
MKAVAGKYIIQTVSRAMDLLEQFQEGDTELGLTDLTTRMKLQKNNVFRLVVTLKEKDYIEINNLTGKYRLGIKTRALGQVATRQTNFENHSRPVLNDLKHCCHETCNFSIIRDGHNYYLDGVESDLPVRVTQRVGSSQPLYCTAAGRVQLAFMAAEQQRELLSASELTKLTPRTITDPDLFQAELVRVAEQGYAIDDQEHDAGVMEIAAPVFDAQSNIVGALSIIGPEMRLAGRRLSEELLPLLCDSAARLSVALGYCRSPKSLPETSIQPQKPKRKTKTAATKPYGFGGLSTC